VGVGMRRNLTPAGRGHLCGIGRTAPVGWLFSNVG
jgi:hypothetical protein